MDIATLFLSLLSGAVVGFVLGVLGGGGSILALPLLLYVVGFEGDPHTAIGTTALAVAASAFANMLYHRREGQVDLRLGLWFAIPGIGGALIGARLGLNTPGAWLLTLFALLMLLVAWRMWMQRESIPRGSRPPERSFRRRVVLPAGLAVGALSGYFGIGGGFLIVPMLIWSAGIGMKRAVGTSLVAVAAFGLTTAARYGVAGKIDLPLAALFILGGLVAGVLGARVAHRLPKHVLRRLFAATLVCVSAYMLYRSAAAW